MLENQGVVKISQPDHSHFPLANSHNLRMHGAVPTTTPSEPQPGTPNPHLPALLTGRVPWLNSARTWWILTALWVVTAFTLSSISGQDLVVTKENDKVVIRFAYDKEVPIFEPVYLLIKYTGEGRAN